MNKTKKKLTRGDSTIITKNIFSILINNNNNINRYFGIAIFVNTQTFAFNLLIPSFRNNNNVYNY